MRAALRRASLVLASLVLAGVVGVAVDFGFRRGRTPGIDAPRSVTSLERSRIDGGVEQWVLIRGHDRAKPVLLFLHGGPGMPAMFLAHAFQRGLERDFVVVHWDRRGAGKSFDARQGPALSVSQTLEDAYALTRSLRERFGQQRIYLVGHSWGSYLGLLAIRGHPEYYRAYVGMGQFAGSRAEVRALQLSFLSRVAQETRDPGLLARLARPTVQVSEDDLFRYGGELHASRSFWPILMTGLRAPEYTFRDALNVKKGADLVAREMKYDVLPRPLEGEIATLEVPVFFFLGRHDLNTPSELAADYLARLDAPLKGLVWFDRSAHFPFFEEPELFHQEMIRVDVAVSRFWKERPAAGSYGS
jgi:pimeloyl-ACP methyl ester carboxylesterase